MREASCSRQLSLIKINCRTTKDTTLSKPNIAMPQFYSVKVLLLISAVLTSAATATGVAKTIPLDEFKSAQLKQAFQTSQLVGLYFGASWCPDTTPVSELFDDEIDDLLLAPSSEEETRRSSVSLVYVSSDDDEAQMQDYMEGRAWTGLPYNSLDRNELKKHFKTAARVEMEELGIEEREFHIPTLIVIDAATQKVLTYSGIQDVQESGSEAIGLWQMLSSATNALESTDLGTWEKIEQIAFALDTSEF